MRVVLLPIMFACLIVPRQVEVDSARVCRATLQFAGRIALPHSPFVCGPPLARCHVLAAAAHENSW